MRRGMLTNSAKWEEEAELVLFELGRERKRKFEESSEELVDAEEIEETEEYSPKKKKR